MSKPHERQEYAIIEASEFLFGSKIKIEDATEEQITRVVVEGYREALKRYDSFQQGEKPDFDTSRNVSEDEIRQWAETRADDAGYLARRLVSFLDGASATLSALRDCEDYFDNRADADCDQDGFIPNEEMRMLSVVRTALAAPDLLDACKKVVHWHGYRGPNAELRHRDAQQPEIAAAMDAIVKAQGGAA